MLRFTGQLYQTIILSFLAFHKKKPSLSKKVVNYRKIGEIDVESFKQDIMESSLYNSPADNINELVEQYNSTLGNLLDQHAPAQSKKVTLKCCPFWYNSSILSAKKSRRKAERKWRKSKLNVHHTFNKLG